LAYLHPLFMAAVLGLGLLVLREGLASRRARLRGLPFSSVRHRKLARWFVSLVTLGYGFGLVSMGWIRSEPLFDSFHSIFASGALIGVVVAWLLGRQLERVDAPEVRTVHPIWGGVGLLLALLAAAAGIAILP
jgi:hypothetical protein